MSWSERVSERVRSAPEPDDLSEFAEVARARDQSEALVIRSLLEAHGIRVWLRTRLAPSVHPFTVGEQAEVLILVPRAAVDDTRRLLVRLAPDPSAPEPPPLT